MIFLLLDEEEEEEDDDDAAGSELLGGLDASRCERGGGSALADDVVASASFPLGEDGSDGSGDVILGGEADDSDEEAGEEVGETLFDESWLPFDTTCTRGVSSCRRIWSLFMGSLPSPPRMERPEAAALLKPDEFTSAGWGE